MTKPWLRPSYHDCVADEDTFLSAPSVWNHPGHKWTYQHSSKETGLYRCTQERAITNQVPLKHKWKERIWLFDWNNPRSTFCPSASMSVCLHVSSSPSSLSVCLSDHLLVCQPVYMLVSLSCLYAYPFVGLPAHMATCTCLAWLSHCSPPSPHPQKKIYLRHGALKRSHKFISVTSVTTFPCLARDIWCDTLKLRSTKTKH